MSEVEQTIQVQVPALPLPTMREMCESVPPGETRWVKSVAIVKHDRYGSNTLAVLPDIRLHCGSDECGGIRTFQPMSEHRLVSGKYNELSVRFWCRNCRSSVKHYFFTFELNLGGATNVLKLAEDPGFGDPIPARVFTLVGGERDYFLKGRRCENQGLGIAAFAYYRRVIENQKAKIFGEIIRVSKRLGADAELISDLEAASKETQFSKAVDHVRHGLPQSLLINGHNPLTLLHSALSEGLHAQTDEQCLELATSIRVVLFDFVERVATALKDEAELNQAVTRLLKPPAKAGGSDGGTV
jgi:hypothetical protein